MKYNKKLCSYIFCIVISLVIFVMYCNSQKYYFLKKDVFYEWVMFTTNGVLVIIGALSTIIAVLITINNSDRREQLKKIETINKLKIILKNEIELLIDYYEYLVLLDLKNRIKKSLKENSLETTYHYDLLSKPIFKLNNDFLNRTYKLLMISHNKFDDDIKQILLLYNFVTDIEVKYSMELENDGLFTKDNKGSKICRKLFNDNLLEIYKKLDEIEKQPFFYPSNYNKKYTVNQLNDIIVAFHIVNGENKSGKIHINNYVKQIISFLGDVNGTKSL